MKYLRIEGVLEFDNNMSHILEADIIFINGGNLIIGWENDPILTNVTIKLNGQKDQVNYMLPNGLETIGGKAIGVYGGLDIHGKRRNVSWTTLSQTSRKGSNIINLDKPVDWLIGEEIIITTTSFKMTESEIFRIVEISSNMTTIKLNGSLLYDHLVVRDSYSSGISYKIGAAVGLLTRNVKIIGTEYANQDSDLYGFRIIVSDYSDGVNYYKGFARIDNVQFIRPGQFSRNSGDDAKYGILFSNLGPNNGSTASYVKYSSFQNGYSVAISITDSSSILIENNVIYKTLDMALFILGHSNIIRNNLIAANYWPCTFVTWQADYTIDYFGAIDVRLADSVVLENNYVAGSERVGIHYRGDVCSGSVFSPSSMNHSIKNNIIVASLAGVAIFPKWSFTNFDCLKISTFTIFKSTHYGIYYQSQQSVNIESNILIDNQINVLSKVIFPSILQHTLSNKYYNLKNSVIVGQSSTFDCVRDVKPNDFNFLKAATINSFGAGLNSKGMIGVTWADFSSGSNAAPYKPWYFYYYQIFDNFQFKNLTIIIGKT